jgi:hypothetical protein
MTRAGRGSIMAGCGVPAPEPLLSGLVLSGQVVGRYGIAAVIWLNAALLAAVALCAPRVR